MKGTLLATHAWLDCPIPGYRDVDGTCRRVKRWLDRYQHIWPDIMVFDNGSDPDTCSRFEAEHGVRVVNLQPNYPRGEQWDYPNVWRPYWHMRSLLESDAYSRIFYISTDAYILNMRLLDYMFNVTTGWTALWCPTYNFPEPQYQIITLCDAFRDFFSGECDPFRYNGLCEETLLPFTHVERGFVGDRYGEWFKPYEPDMDFYSQIPDAFDWNDDMFPTLVL